MRTDRFQGSEEESPEGEENRFEGRAVKKEKESAFDFGESMGHIDMISV